jgi:hypothetical protein
MLSFKKDYVYEEGKKEGSNKKDKPYCSIIKKPLC